MAKARANGIELEYESYGPRPAPAVLLIMGVGAQLTLWPDQFHQNLVKEGFRVVRFDNRDAGKSTHLIGLGVPDVLEVMRKAGEGVSVETPYTLEDMAQDVIGLLDALRIDAAHLIGVSMGAMIAQIVAAKFPARARSLVSAMSTTGRRSLPQARRDVLTALMSPPRSAARDDLIEAGLRSRKALASPGYPISEQELRAVVAAGIDRVPYEPTGAARQLAAIFAAEPRVELLERIHCPTLVLHGADDPLIPVQAGEDTAKCISGARLVILPGASHDLTTAIASVYLAHICPFLAAVERQR